jgi:hypothetical protein
VRKDQGFETEMNWIPRDTTIEAARKQIEILRKMSSQKRALISFELSDNVRQNAIAGIKKLHPDFTDSQIKMELLRRTVGDELFRKVIAAKGLK